VLPIDHPLESWGYHSPAAGCLGLVQPVMRAVFGTRPFGDLLIELARKLPDPVDKAFPWDNTRAFVEIRFEELAAGTSLDEIKRRGGISFEVEKVEPELRPDANISAIGGGNEVGGDLPLLLFPHPYLFDGRGADKPWLQETPETSTSATWESWVEIHPETARAIGVDRGDAIKLSRNAGEITVPALITPQVMPDVLAIPLGQGHEELGRWAQGRGVNPLLLLDNADGLMLAGIEASAARVPGGGAPILAAGSQEQGIRGLARAVPLAGIGEVHEDSGHGYDATLYPEQSYPKYDWGMVIDLDRCVGCGACVVACYAG